MNIRRAKHSDAASLAALSIEVWVGTYLRKGISEFFADYVLSEFTKANFESLLVDANEIFFVSENLDGIDGFIRISLGRKAPVEGCSATEISTLYVQPGHHRKGIGGKLLNAAMAHCARLGVDSVWLTTNSENTPAIGYYLSRGFVKCGVTYFRIGDQAYPNDVLSLAIEADRVG